VFGDGEPDVAVAHFGDRQDEPLLSCGVEADDPAVTQVETTSFGGKGPRKADPEEQRKGLVEHRSAGHGLPDFGHRGLDVAVLGDGVVGEGSHPAHALQEQERKRSEDHGVKIPPSPGPSHVHDGADEGHQPPREGGDEEEAEKAFR
jgi:hypothetical protein